jgi:hypothetical protein
LMSQDEKSAFDVAVDAMSTAMKADGVAARVARDADAIGSFFTTVQSYFDPTDEVFQKIGALLESVKNASTHKGKEAWRLPKALVRWWPSLPDTKPPAPPSKNQLALARLKKLDMRAEADQKELWDAYAPIRDDDNDELSLAIRCFVVRTDKGKVVLRDELAKCKSLGEFRKVFKSLPGEGRLTLQTVSAEEFKQIRSEYSAVHNDYGGTLFETGKVYGIRAGLLALGGVPGFALASTSFGAVANAARETTAQTWLYWNQDDVTRRFIRDVAALAAEAGRRGQLPPKHRDAPQFLKELAAYVNTNYILVDRSDGSKEQLDEHLKSKHLGLIVIGMTALTAMFVYRLARTKMKDRETAMQSQSWLAARSLANQTPLQKPGEKLSREQMKEWVEHPERMKKERKLLADRKASVEQARRAKADSTTKLEVGVAMGGAFCLALGAGGLLSGAIAPVAESAEHLHQVLGKTVGLFAEMLKPGAIAPQDVKVYAAANSILSGHFEQLSKNPAQTYLVPVGAGLMVENTFVPWQSVMTIVAVASFALFYAMWVHRNYIFDQFGSARAPR